MSSFCRLLNVRGVKDFCQTLQKSTLKFYLPFPNHIKIEVGGIKDKIILGAPMTFADPRLKSQRHAEMFNDSPYSGIYNYLFTRE